MAEYINEMKRIGDKVIRKYQILTTNLVVYDAYEPSVVMGKHSTITTIEGRWYGRIGSRYLPPEIEKLPAGPERLIYVGRWHEDQYNEAYNLILQAFPEAAKGRRGMGEITLQIQSTGSNPREVNMGISPHCEIVLKQPMTREFAYDFRAIRGRVMCEAWRLMQEKRIPFRDAVRQSWVKVKEEAAGIGAFV